MPSYRTVLVGTVTERWTQRKQQKEMDALSAILTSQAQNGWRLHSLQPMPLFGGVSRQQSGIVLLAVYEAD